MKQKIETFIDEAVKNNNYKLLDILWTFSYSLSYKSGYYDNKKERVEVGFKRWFYKVCERNLQKKYNLKEIEIKEKMKIFLDFLDSIPEFLSYETFDNDKVLLKGLLIERGSESIVQNIKSRLADLYDLDKNILSFVLNYIPIRIQDSIKEADEQRKKGFDVNGKYAKLSDFEVETEGDSGDIVYFVIDPKEWTYIFNLLFDEELKEYKPRTKSPKRSVGFIFPPSEQREEYSFWEFGDELVKMSLGYWIFYLSASGNVYPKFIIPNFLYETIESNKEKLPKREAFEKRINEIKKEKASKKVEKWDLEDFEETETVSEEDIEDLFESDPEVLEKGLKLIERQKTTDAGIIDLLCWDKEDNYVVIELKKDKTSDKVVGQILRYMAWVEENLADKESVRGIIVAQAHDRKLEYAIKGSRYPIEVKKFGPDAPVKENIKYCDKCKAANRKSAKFCVKCGNNFWLE